MDVSQYLEIFIDETREHLQALNEHILILEKEPDNQDTINEIFRAAHSLKGMAGTMGYTRMQRLTHDMENVFSEIRNGNMTASDDLVDVLFKGLDALENYLDNIVETAAEGTEDNEDIINRLNEILAIGTGKMKETASKPATESVAPYDTVSFSPDKYVEMLSGSRLDSTSFTEGQQLDSSSSTKGQQIDDLNRTYTEDYTLHRVGNIGVQTVSDMLGKHIKLWSLWEFYEYIFKEICKDLLLI